MTADETAPSPRPTERFERVLAFATDEADGLGHGFVTCQHLMYALARESKGIASAALEASGATADAIHAALVESAATHDRTGKGRIDLADEARDALERAVDAAREWGHRVLDTEHLLHGIIIAPTSADDILSDLRVDPNTLLNQLYALQQAAPETHVRDEATHAYRFTLESAWLLSLATDYARRLGGDRVSSLYLLLALLSLPNTAAYDALVGQMGLSVEVLTQHMQGATVPKYTHARLPLSDELQRILGAAIGEAWNRGHMAVKPIHVAMGLARTERCVALELLADFGVPQAELLDALEEAIPPSTLR